MSTEADIVETLNTAWVADALEAGYIRSTVVAERMIRERHAALDEITKLREDLHSCTESWHRTKALQLKAEEESAQLRAERDAAARDMRERCAKVVERLFEPVHTFSSENADLYRAQDRACELAAAKIRALPDSAIIATDREVQS